MITSATELPAQDASTHSSSSRAASSRRASLFVEDSDPVFVPQPRRSSSRDNSAKMADMGLSSYYRSPIDSGDRPYFPRPSIYSPGSSPASNDSQRPSTEMGGTNRVSSPSTSGEASPASLKIDTTWAQVRSNVAQRRDASKSPNPLDHSDMRRPPGRVGALGLATMHEESDHMGLHRAPSNSARPSYLTSEPDTHYRPSRHRSSSSAAALALHSTGSAFTDRWSSSSSGRIASAVPSRAAWDRESISNKADTAPSSGAPRSQPQLQRGFSASFVGTQPGFVPASPFLSSPGSRYDSSHEYADQSPAFPLHSNFRATSSPYGPSNGFPDMLSHSSADYESHQRTGRESRRHSVAGPHPYDTLGIIGDPRRALGFDVEPRSKFGNLEMAHEQLSRDKSHRAFNGMIGNGSLAFSADDLAVGYDQLPSQTGTDRATIQELGHRHIPPPLHPRDPAAYPGDSRTHAASMPTAQFGGGLDAYTPSSSAAASSTRRPNGAVSASSTGTGLDSLSTSWDVIMTPSRQSGHFFQHEQEKLVDVSRQLQQISIGATESGKGGLPLARRSSVFEERKEGTETVRASPGTSPVDLRSNPGRFALSAQAKSFNTVLSTPLSSAPRGLDLAQASITRRQTAFPAAMLGDATAAATYSGPSFASMSLDTARPQPVDTAFSSLAALGPLPPSSMGVASGGMGSQGDLQDLGKGVSLGSLPQDARLYIVEFKQGRTDLFFRITPAGRPVTDVSRDKIHCGDLVIVEADRGKDLGTVVNDSITVEQVQAFLLHQSDLTTGSVGSARGSDLSAELGTATDEAISTVAGLGISPSSSLPPGNAAMSSVARPLRSINPKRLFAKATAANTSTLYSKAQDEDRALQLCSAKVNQRGLPMTVVAAEMQWDRRKLTFYYTASMRVDFRDLVKELFRLYKTRIWMCHLGHPSGTGMG